MLSQKFSPDSVQTLHHHQTLSQSGLRLMLNVSVYECVPIQNQSGVSFIHHLNVVRHLASSATENLNDQHTFHQISKHFVDMFGTSQVIFVLGLAFT